MKTSTALALVLATALMAPGEAALAKPKHAAHAAGAKHGASHHASGKPAGKSGAKAHGAKSHSAKDSHGKGVKGRHAKGDKAEKAGRHGKKARPEHHARAAPPPPPPKPQVLTPPSRADRIILPAGVSPSRYDISIVPDIGKDSFTGRVRIDVEVKTATRQIKLNATDLTFDSVTLTGASGPARAAKWTFDASQETATLSFPAAVKPGRYTLVIAYAGKINPRAAGLFHLDYDGVSGRQRALFTQFENSEARRFVPSWDEPARKAAFSLTVDAPADQMVVSNMPQLSSDGLPSGLKRVRFRETPAMSPYLLFVGVGDFERVVRKVGNTEIGVVVKRGDGEQTGFALDAAAELLTYYNDYFGTPYPLPKLDLVGGPGASQFFGAMENWGAIFAFDRNLLVDPATSTIAEKQRVYTVIAHEMAHQWFGDLVTMEWWDDLWLNEGFARWMQGKATHQLHPEWRTGLSTLATRESAMRLDAREGAHAVVQHVRDVHQASEAFDSITYDKGAAVIGMLEAYVGPDNFRAGVRRYIQTHQGGSTVTDDLWKDIDAVSPVKITGMAHDFTLQPGTPLLTVTQDGAGATLNQGRFGVDAGSRVKLRWEVPVTTARVYGAGAWRGLVSTVEPASLKAPVDGLVVNTGQSAYARTLYTGQMFTRLLEAWPRLTPADQIGLLHDVTALSLNGDQPVSDLMNLLDRAGSDLDAAVASVLIDKLLMISDLQRDLPGEQAFNAFALRKLSALRTRLDADPRAGSESALVALRSTLINGMARLRDPQTLADARARYAAWKADPSSLRADDRASTLHVIALNADADTWAELKGFAAKAPRPTERQTLYNLLAQARDPALAKQALDLAFTAEVPVTQSLNMVRLAAVLYPDMALEYALSHPEEVAARLEPASVPKYMPSLAERSSDPIAIEKLDAYAAISIPDTARKRVAAAESAIRYNERVKATRMPEVDRWVTAHPN